jgi:hypothetical protein
MTIAQAAEMFGIKHARTFHRYETGEILADSPFVEKAALFSNGEVAADDFYAQRKDWLAANSICIPEAAE